MHELAEVEDDGPGEDVEFLQRKNPPNEVVLVRCPSCKGLREMSIRHVTRNSHMCVDCRKGNVVPKSQFRNYWTSRYTMEEIEEMGRAIWG